MPSHLLVYAVILLSFRPCHSFFSVGSRRFGGGSAAVGRCSRTAQLWAGAPDATQIDLTPTAGATGSTAEAVTRPAKSKVIDQVEPAITQLLDLLPRIQSDEDHDTIEKLISQLTATYKPIHTIGFLNLGMHGEWQFKYTTSNLPSGDPRLRLRKVSQRVSVSEEKPQTGNLTNAIIWDLVKANPPCTGLFEVQATYNVNMKGDLELKFHDYVLQPSSGMPEDPVELVGLIQRAIPPEIFHPDGVRVHVAYMDSKLRILQCSGSKFGTVTNIYHRADPL